MKTQVLFLLTFLTLNFGAFAQQAEKDSIQVLSISKFEKMASKKKNTLIDVRAPEEISEGQIKGAINMNLLGETFDSELQHLDKNKTYLLYCKTGKRTRRAADKMQKAGFKHVYMLDGGITAWEEAGNPIEK